MRIKLPRIGFQKRISSHRTSIFLWVAYTAFLFPIYLFSRLLLPEKFFFDEKTLLEYQKTSSEFIVGDSFVSTAYLFKTIGFNGSTTSSFIYSIISFFLVLCFLFSTINRAKPKTITLSEAFVLLYFSFSQCIFLGILGKDFIVLILIILFWILQKKSTPGLIIWTITTVIYAVYFRFQWLITIALFWVYYLILKKELGILNVFIKSIIILTIMSISFDIFLDIPIDHFRDVVNMQRLDEGVEDAKTMIYSYLPSGGILSLANVTITLAFLILPIPLLLLLTPYYFVSFSAISILFLLIFRSFHKFNPSIDDERRSCFALVFSVLITQCIYEPDYGSFIRHLTPVFNIIFFLIIANKTDQRK